MTEQRVKGTERLPSARDWAAEYAELSAREPLTSYEPADIEHLAGAAYLAGDQTGCIDVLTRAHALALERGETRQGARFAFWIAFSLIGQRESSRATGWVARARRLLEDYGHECVECGYVMVPQALGQTASGDLPGAAATFETAEHIGERFADRDLICLARQGRGRVLVNLGRVEEGVALFDEVMVAVTAGEVTAFVSGVVYCSVISACFDMLDLRRAQEWTDALTEWCQRQSGMVPYRGECLAYRAEIFRLRGRWSEALDEAQRAYDALLTAKGATPGAAAYARAELHRLRGELNAAEDAYRLASEHGRAPYPGLALLRLAQGDLTAARAAIERVMAERAPARRRAEVLDAAIEIRLSCGDLATARKAADELRAMAAGAPSDWLRAMAAEDSGAVLLAEGEPQQALGSFRDALIFWHELGAPYEAARVRMRIGEACRAVGDCDGARLEWAGATRVFREFGAARALAHVESLTQSLPATTSTQPGSLTPRELEVLRLVAKGKSNRLIARELRISEKTVARHISNIFTKLDLPSRSAATAYAFTHRLVT
jgi:DNA-binding CsgD family transcriptional regulator/predicted negative regulator of RcsB-dependent stress response